MAKSTLSARVQQLESDLNVRLLNRSTRKFGLSDVGGAFYAQAQVLLHEAERAENIARRRLSETAGIVRISTSVTVAQFALRDILPGFLRRFPGIIVVQRRVLVRVCGAGLSGTPRRTAAGAGFVQP